MSDEPKTDELELDDGDSAIICTIKGGIRSGDVSLRIIGEVSSFQFYGIAELIRHQATKMMARADMMQLAGEAAEAQQNQQLAQKLGLIKGGRRTDA